MPFSYLVTWFSNNRRENHTWTLLIGETCLTETRAIIDYCYNSSTTLLYEKRIVRRSNFPKVAYFQSLYFVLIKYLDLLTIIRQNVTLKSSSLTFYSYFKFRYLLFLYFSFPKTSAPPHPFKHSLIYLIKSSEINLVKIVQHQEMISTV